GLFCFPQFADPQALPLWLTRHGLPNDQFEQLTAFRHTFSHFHLDIVPIWKKVGTIQRCMCMDAGSGLWYNLAHPPVVGLAAPVERLLLQLSQSR
ncbi:NUDIX domain-containing protein, partial [Sodalis-like endosymbiont of Proechinophthirus fluctus]|uniref:NUDIX domain-containing protein n=1 Tax=Sodalis-like endosymbiont of Proechinophthirus fluctus TaxID=1462730 RepID=UPI001FCC1697